MNLAEFVTKYCLKGKSEDSKATCPYWQTHCTLSDIGGQRNMQNCLTVNHNTILLSVLAELRLIKEKGEFP